MPLKKSPYRQKGKISELALGYQGGAGALKTMGALAMGLTEDELDPIKDAMRAGHKPGSDDGSKALHYKQKLEEIDT